MTLKQRISAFVQVNMFITRHFSNNKHQDEAVLHDGLDQLIGIVQQYNGWFVPSFVNKAIKNTSILLQEDGLTEFCKNFPEKTPKKVAIICAGNIPLVCFHDILCVLLSGHRALIKLSVDDNLLLPFFLKLLVHYEPAFEPQIEFAVGKLSNFDAVIATGSNNTAGHFQYYFSKYPNIIRKNRSSIAVLNGNESDDELMALGEDIFSYFGLGCRNIRKVLVPESYSFNRFFENIVSFGEVINNNKYGNNYDYNRAIYLLESLPFLDNNFLMVKESKELHAPIGVLYYQTYASPEELNNYLKEQQDELQCVVGKGYIPFGCSQSPVISDFADNVNTMDFLLNL